MTIVAALVSFFFVTAEDADRLRATAPAYLTVETARTHYGAARIASAIAGVDPDQLLAIAWHESRYDFGYVQHEPPDPDHPELGPRVSCGAMTPRPHYGGCEPWELTPIGGYVAGARHLRTWIDLCRGDQICGLTAYAGGGKLVTACRDGSDHRGCGFAGEMIARGRWIVRLRGAA